MQPLRFVFILIWFLVFAGLLAYSLQMRTNTKAFDAAMPEIQRGT